MRPAPPRARQLTRDARGSTAVQDSGAVDGRRTPLADNPDMEATTGFNPSAVAPVAGFRERLARLFRSDEIGGDAAARLEFYLRGSDAVVLHRCRVPGKRGRISHVVVGPAGITVVDSRNYKGRKATVRSHQLLVGNRDRPDLIEGVLVQAGRVRGLLAETPYADVDVNAALAWGRVEGSRSVHHVDGTRVTVWGTGRIASEAARPGPLSSREVESLASYLAHELSA
jgi:Nuclease-related domain